MKLSDVKTAGTALKKGRRVGRGPGSGRGCTAGRGNKGQGSRSGVGGGLGHEGGQMPLIRRLPKRGFTNAVFKVTYGIANVGDLVRTFPEGGDVDLARIVEAGLLPKRTSGLKILGVGETTVAFRIRADRASASARAKIEAAGGSIATTDGSGTDGA